LCYYLYGFLTDKFISIDYLTVEGKKVTGMQMISDKENNTYCGYAADQHNNDNNTTINNNNNNNGNNNGLTKYCLRLKVGAVSECHFITWKNNNKQTQC